MYVDGGRREKISRRAGLVIGLYFLGAGAFLVVSNLHMYRLFGVCVGIAFCLCAPGFAVAPWKERLAATGRLWIYRATVVFCLCAFLLLLGAGVALWLDFGSNVAASRMVRHPLFYNDRLVYTSGEVLAGGGKCTLLVPGVAGHSKKVTVWLSSRSKLCAAATTTRIHADVSGTFTVLRSTRHLPRGYVLTGATIIPAKVGTNRHHT